MNIIKTKILCGITGFESPATDFLKPPLSLDDLLMPNASSTFIGQATGDSMIGLGIWDGDLLIINRGIEPENMSIIVAAYRGSLICKILDKKNRKLISANPDIPDITIDESDDFAIEGCVTSSVRVHQTNLRIRQPS